MIGALLFLLFNSWRNRIVMRIRRLRQPKYLVGAIIGGAYFYFYFFRYLFRPGIFGNRGAVAPGSEHLIVLETIGAAIFCVFVVLAWVIPHERGALVFSEAEVAFLFPAPVKRKTLIHYKLLKSQTSVLFTTLIFSLLFRRAGGGPGWTRALGWWVILSTLNLHMIAASFARTMLMERGISTWKRRVGVLAIVAVAIGVVVIWARQSIPLPDANDVKGMSDLEYYLRKAAASGPMPYLLFPFKLVVRPYVYGYLGGDMKVFFLSLWPALLLMLAHYWWVVRSDVAFEEASVEASRKMAERVANMRANRGQLVGKPKKGKKPPFQLQPVGSPAVGFLWKNLIGAGQMFTWRFWLVILAVTLSSGISFAANTKLTELSMLLGMLSTILLGMSLLVGPQMVRQDFRRDLPMADVLKAYPLAGWQVALGELLAPAVILAAVQWVLITACVVLLSKVGNDAVELEVRLEIGLGLAVIVPALNVVMLIIPNAAVLLFPGWFQTGKDAPQGIEMTGQRLIFALGQFLVFIVAMLPVAAVFALVYFLARLVAGEPFLPVLVAAVPSAMVLAVEAWLGVMWLGRLFNKFDLSAETGS